MKFNCLTCGACCAYFHLEEKQDSGNALYAVPINPKCNSVPPKFVQIGRRTEIADSQKDADENGFYFTTKFVRPQGLKCSALQGTIGKQIKCVIYEQRPPVCRQFEAGSEKCLEAREAYLGKL
jgi:uncharacterized protein